VKAVLIKDKIILSRCFFTKWEFLLFANAFLAVVPFSSLSRHLICSSPTLSFISPAIFLYSLPAFFTFLVSGIFEFFILILATNFILYF